MAKVENGWFAEINDLWYGQAMSFEVENVLCHKKSQYQDILIFKSKSHGNVLVLDGCVQCTDKDEFTYQEMITYLPLNSHPNPKKVLVIGAGDGGVIREIAKHPSVESIVQCEIDEEVVNMSKKYLPNMSCGYKSPKHILNVGCGKEFMKQHQGEFDVIITDSSDPIGPAASLFQKEYYELMKSALKPDGILCSQGECPWLDSQFIKSMFEFCKPLFPVVQYAYTNVPTYPCGQIGFLMCSRNPETKFDQPLTRLTSCQLASSNFKFYNTDLHKAAFAIPQFFDKQNNDYNKTGGTVEKLWFWEKQKNLPGQSFGLIQENRRFHGKIDSHDVLVFENFIYGNVLVVDDVIRRTERSQALYEESLAHLALACHPDPKKVLIIGDLSGGIIQEVSRYQSVQEIVQCEESEALLDVSRKYFDQASGYNNRKLQELYIGDYMEYLEGHHKEYDVIITVPTETFLQPCTTDVLKSALKLNGIVISQLPSFWQELDAIHSLYKYNKGTFPIVKLAYSCIPTSTFGQATFILRSLNSATCFGIPVQQLPDDELSQLYFYNAKVHSACLALPEFVRKVIEN